MENQAESSVRIPSPLSEKHRPVLKISLIKPGFPRRKIDKTLAQAFKTSGMSAEKFASVRLNNWVERTMVRADRTIAG